MTYRRKLLCSTVLVGGLFGITTEASATPSYTPTETASVTFGGEANDYSMSGSTVLTVNGFNSSLGNLVGVYLTLSLSGTLNNVASITSTPYIAQSVGSPTALTASATTYVSAPLGLNLNTSFSTPGFVGTVTTGSLNIVGTNTVTDQTVNNSLTSDLAAYIGGTNAISIDVLEDGTQGGSVPGNVLTGNTGTADIVLTVDYAYTNAVTTPEPASMSLMGLGMVGLGVLRRRRKSN